MKKIALIVVASVIFEISAMDSSESPREDELIALVEKARQKGALNLELFTILTKTDPLENKERFGEWVSAHASELYVASILPLNPTFQAVENGFTALCFRAITMETQSDLMSATQHLQQFVMTHKDIIVEHYKKRTKAERTLLDLFNALASARMLCCIETDESEYSKLVAEINVLQTTVENILKNRKEESL